MRPFAPIGRHRITSKPEVERRGGHLGQWDKPLRASAPALQGSRGSDRRDELLSIGRGLALPGYEIGLQNNTMIENAWTKDSSGNYVRWNEPPHYVDGPLTLTLPGEDVVSHAELRKRRGEYMKLCWREIRKRHADR